MRVSIITINLNNRNGLQKTIDSVVSQSFKDFEWIVIDGGSSDGSRELIERYAEHFAYWVSEPDSGVYNAMNKGIREAKGEYLLFLNSGDFLISAEGLSQVFSEERVADIINARCTVSEGGKQVWVSPFLQHLTLKTLYTIGLPHQSTFIKRSLFDWFGLYREDFKYNSDIAFWYKSILFGGATTQGVDVVLTDYNVEGISSKNVRTEAYKQEMKEILSEGILPRVLPDYDEWLERDRLFQQYAWIEHHKGLQMLLKMLHKFFKKNENGRN